MLYSNEVTRGHTRSHDYQFHPGTTFEAGIGTQTGFFCSLQTTYSPSLHVIDFVSHGGGGGGGGFDGGGGGVGRDDGLKYGGG